MRGRQEANGRRAGPDLRLSDDARVLVAASASPPPGATAHESTGMTNGDREWDVQPAPARVVAIGDLHGDVRALGAIGRAAGLLDERGSWNGGRAHLVLMGDLLGGDDSRRLIRAVMRLEREAREQGGRVHSLVGNYDILPARGRFEKLTRKERRTYRRDDFRKDGPFSEWLRNRPTVLRIGSTVFVHAGLGRRVLETGPAAVNAQVRAWIAHDQGVAPKPPEDTAWTVDENYGPMWTRAFKARGGKLNPGPSRKAMREILDGLAAERMVIGHARTGTGIVTDHPHYGGAVVMVDTSISDDQRGRLSALVIENGALAIVYAEDRADGEALREREKERVRPPGFMDRVRGLVARAFGQPGRERH